MSGTVQLGCISGITERYPLIEAKMINHSAMLNRTIDKQELKKMNIFFPMHKRSISGYRLTFWQMQRYVSEIKMNFSDRAIEYACKCNSSYAIR